MRALVCLLAVTTVLLASAPSAAPVHHPLGDLQADALELLGRAPGVGQVERIVSPHRPKHRIIHIVDYHCVALENLAADLRDQDAAVTDADIRDEYDRIMAVVGRVQVSERELIRWLAANHDVRRIHLEGLSDADVDAYRFLVRTLGRQGADRLPPHLGAVAQSFVAGEIDEVAAAEDEAAYLAANPVGDDGVELGGLANAAREAAIVRRLVASGTLAVIVLGGNHDLSEHIRAIGDCEYLRVFVKGYGDQ